MGPAVDGRGIRVTRGCLGVPDIGVPRSVSTLGLGLGLAKRRSMRESDWRWLRMLSCMDLGMADAPRRPSVSDVMPFSFESGFPELFLVRRRLPTGWMLDFRPFGFVVRTPPVSGDLRSIVSLRESSHLAAASAQEEFGRSGRCFKGHDHAVGGTHAARKKQSWVCQTTMTATSVNKCMSACSPL